MNSINPHSFSDSTPTVLEEGVYGATFYLAKEPLYLRMERVTAESAQHWQKYADYCVSLTTNARGILPILTRWSGIKPQFSHYTEQLGELTGCEKEEFDAFLRKLIALREKAEEKILAQLRGIPAGFGVFNLSPDKESYVVYITKNSAFSISKVCPLDARLNYKKFCELYSDILISVGSDFSGSDHLHNRGISRNPHWVIEEKYAGLSMLLHGFSSAVAESFFPGKNTFYVRPTGSMQAILIKQLQKGDGVVKIHDQEVDITSLPAAPNNPQLYGNSIKVSALTRIYHETIAKLMKGEL